MRFMLRSPSCDSPAQVCQMLNEPTLNKQHQSRQVLSNQVDIHPDLLSITKRHCDHPYQKPISNSQRIAYEKARMLWTQQGCPDTILDIGCGTGISTRFLARCHPHVLVIGIDPSIHRLSKSIHDTPNVLFIRARAEEFWLQMAQDNWRPIGMTFFYPNPWPKKKHIKRRWHAHPIWPQIQRWQCPMLLRTNWEIYAREWHFVCEALSVPAKFSRFHPIQPITRFEAKYQASGHTLFQVSTDHEDILKLASTVL